MISATMMRIQFYMTTSNDEEIQFIRQCVHDSFVLYDDKYPQLGGKEYLRDHFLVDLPIYRNMIIADQLARTLPQKACVLDFGFGYGDMAYLIRNRRQDIKITGLEILTSEPWQILTSRIKLKTVIDVDESRIPLASASFDAIVANGALEHVRDERTSLRELRRILRPGGILYIFLYPNMYSYTEFIQKHIGHPSHEVKKTLAGLSSLLESEGFTVVEKRRQFFLPFTLSRFSPPIRKLYNFLAKPICALNSIAEQIPLLNLFCATLTIHAEHHD